MSAQTVISRAQNQGVSLAKPSDATPMITTPATPDVDSKIGCFVASGLDRGNLRALRATFRAMAARGTMAALRKARGF